MKELFINPRLNLAFAMAKTLRCPKCGEHEQVQVTDHNAEPMQWRCRMCRHCWSVPTQQPVQERR